MAASNRSEIVEFGHESASDRRRLKQFVDFHWAHYRGDARYVPLLDYEYLGSRLLGITGFFEQRNLFFTHGAARFFLAVDGERIVGRCVAFVNDRHNAHAADRTGFFGHFECVDDVETARALLGAAETWVRARGMTSIRGPQNFPVNEATPGFLVDGFDARPVVYYHFNKPYYAPLARACGYRPVMHYLSWECDVKGERLDPSFAAACEKVVARSPIAIETWRARPYATRRQEMFDVYNDAWHDNWGFVPFTQPEFFKIVDDMRLIIVPELFLFLYVRGELAAFFGGVPNLFEVLQTNGERLGPEWLRAVRLLLRKSRIRGFRLGYLGVRKRFRRLGLDAVALLNQQRAAHRLGYEYCDLGWVLETNRPVIQMAERFGAVPSKRYALFEKTME